jgi:hypothetical protein
MRLIDMVNALKERGRILEAEYYGLILPAQLLLKHGFSEKKTLLMELDEIEHWMKLPEKPAKYEGWNFWWGEAALVDLY